MFIFLHGQIYTCSTNWSNQHSLTALVTVLLIVMQVIADIDMTAQQVSLKHTWCLIRFVCECLVLTLVWHVCLLLTNIGNSCQWDSKLNPNGISGKDVDIYSLHIL